MSVQPCRRAHGVIYRGSGSISFVSSFFGLLTRRLTG
jgi:hypothetical protein